MASPTRALSLSTTLPLASGHHIPTLGFGVYKALAAECTAATVHALSSGYRHIDSARAYNNEGPVAEAMRASGLPRSSIFLTTKVPPGPGPMGYEGTKKQIATSFAKTDLDYIDLYLVHAPYGTAEDRKGTWRALVEAQAAGKIRSLGVCNYAVRHLDELEAYMKELEAEHGKGKGGSLDVGQWELHPWLTRPEIVEWCQQRNVVIEAYSPLVRGQRAEEKTLQDLATKHGKTWAQILVRWSLQKVKPVPNRTGLLSFPI